MYKLPQDHHSPYGPVKEGYGYFYMDVNNIQWQMGKIPLNETKHALYYTLQQVYDNVKSQVDFSPLCCRVLGLFAMVI